MMMSFARYAVCWGLAVKQTTIISLSIGLFSVTKLQVDKRRSVHYYWIICVTHHHDYTHSKSALWEDLGLEDPLQILPQLSPSRSASWLNEAKLALSCTLALRKQPGYKYRKLCSVTPESLIPFCCVLLLPVSVISRGAVGLFSVDASICTDGRTSAISLVRGTPDPTRPHGCAEC